MLLDPLRSTVLVIDVQKKLLPAIHDHATVAANVAWLVRAAQKMGVEIRQHEHSMLAGAIGAALWGAFRARKLRRLRERVAS